MILLKIDMILIKIFTKFREKHLPFKIWRGIWFKGSLTNLIVNFGWLSLLFYECVLCLKACTRPKT